jgi:hypothetical protein
MLGFLGKNDLSDSFCFTVVCDNYCDMISWNFCYFGKYMRGLNVYITFNCSIHMNCFSSISKKRKLL